MQWVRTKLLHTGRAEAQPQAVQQPPDATERGVGQPVTTDADRVPSPAPGRRSRRRRGGLLASFLPRTLVQAFFQRLLPLVVTVKSTPAGRRRGGGRTDQGVLPPGHGRAKQTRCPGRVVGATRSEPRQREPRRQRFGGRQHSARGQRAWDRGRDERAGRRARRPRAPGYGAGTWETSSRAVHYHHDTLL